MSKEAVFIVGLTGLKIKEDLGRGDKFYDDMFVTNNKDSLRSVLNEKNVINLLGGIEWSFLNDCDALIYSKFEINEDTNGPEHLIDLMYTANWLLHSTWFFFENAINQSTAYLIIGKGMEMVIHSNSLNQFFVDAESNKNKTVEITRDELRTVREFAMGSVDLQHSLRNRESKNKLFESGGRISRAIFYMQIARTKRVLEIRLALFISALEALFVDSTTEVAHVLAERVARFLGENLESRMEIFSEIKKAYNFRSKVFHGDTVKQSKFDDVNQSSKYAEITLRKCLLKTMQDENLSDLFEQKPEAFSEYMRKLVLT